MKHFYFSLFSTAISCLFTLHSHAEIITHDIGTEPLEIPGNSTDNYVITGSTEKNYVVVGFGYKGSLTLQNCNFNFTTVAYNSPIRITGQDDLSNTAPDRTNVNLILDGDNTIYVNGGGRAGIQVDQGAQINISAIESCDNSSGTLTITQENDNGGAGIGSLNRSYNTRETTATATISNEKTATTAGGNIVISSGTITTKGGHGAGIGGGFRSYYDGMIVIYGGIVNATAIFDAAGIGSGCPRGTGLVEEYAPNSAVVALPPAIISAQGAGQTAKGGIGYNLFSELGLAGTKVRIYIGDPDKPAINVNTEDFLPNANIYVDLSQDQDINKVVSAMVDPSVLDINQVFFGKTNSSGLFSTTGQLQNNTTFFTDATSIGSKTFGQPYLPTETTLPEGGNVELKMLQADFSISSYPSDVINSGYNNTDAVNNATCVKIIYNDDNPLTELVFSLANGSNSDFDEPIFLLSDSSTIISAPKTLKKGDVYYIIIPLKIGKDYKEYSDVLRIIGNWQGVSTGYLRQIVSQIVANWHTEYICEGNSYNFNGEELTKEGTYTNITTNTSVCRTESEVEVLNLVITPIYNQEETLAIRENDLPYTWRDNIIPKETTSGTITYNGLSISGCDSTVHLKLTVWENYHLQDKLTLCSAELPYTWRDTIFKEGTKSGTFVFNRQSIHGSDSIVTLNLTVNPSYHITIVDTIIPGTTYKLNGKTYRETGIYDQIFKTKQQCDSIVTLQLYCNNPVFEVQNPTTCADEPVIEFNINLSDGVINKIKLEFSEKAHQQHFSDTVVKYSNYILIPNSARAGIYDVNITAIYHDQAIKTQKHKFSLLYPSSVLDQHWNDFIGVLTHDYNGGYDFVGFQWYKNNNALAGETHSYTYQPLQMGAAYSVMLEEPNGTRLMSCPIIATPQTEISLYPTLVEPHQIISLHNVEKATIYVFNTIGEPIYNRSFDKGENTFYAPAEPGIYLVKILLHTSHEKTITYKLIVR